RVAALGQTLRPARVMIDQRNLRLAGNLAADADVLLQPHVRVLAGTVGSGLLSPARWRHQHGSSARLAYLCDQLAEARPVLLRREATLLLPAVHVPVVGSVHDDHDLPLHPA